MRATVRVHPEAEAELDAAVRWYEERQAGLGGALLDAVDAAMDDVAEHPQRHPLWPGGGPWRRARIRRFPYLLLYEAQEDGLVVWAFAHVRRQPGYWSARRAP